jgi:hypothetical protein
LDDPDRSESPDRPESPIIGDGDRLLSVLGFSGVSARVGLLDSGDDDRELKNNDGESESGDNDRHAASSSLAGFTASTGYAPGISRTGLVLPSGDVERSTADSTSLVSGLGEREAIDDDDEDSLPLCSGEEDLLDSVPEDGVSECRDGERGGVDASAGTLVGSGDGGDGGGAEGRHCPSSIPVFPPSYFPGLQDPSSPPPPPCLVSGSASLVAGLTEADTFTDTVRDDLPP